MTQERFIAQVRETENNYKTILGQMKAPIKENIDINNQQEMYKIQKSMLQKVDINSIKKKTQTFPNQQLKNVHPVVQHMITKESQTLDVIRKMKKEKALKIIRTYRRYRLRLCIKKRISARQILRAYRNFKLQRASKQVQKQLRSYLSRKRVEQMREESSQTQQALILYQQNLKHKVFCELLKNVEGQREIRMNCPLYPALKKYGGVQRVHQAMLEKQDFWAIFPDEGKYAMAVEFHNKRRMAIVMTSEQTNQDVVMKTKEEKENRDFDKLKLLKSKTIQKRKSQVPLTQGKLNKEEVKKPNVVNQKPIMKGKTLSLKTKDHLKQLEEKRYEDNQLKELERKKFQEAKSRLREFVLNNGSNEEKVKLQRYFKHRYNTFITIMKDALRAKRVQTGKASNEENKGIQSFSVVQKISNQVFQKQKTHEMQKQYFKFYCFRAQQEFDEAIGKYRESHNLSQDQMIYIVLGAYPDVREAMNKRGWIEHEQPKDGEKFSSKAFHFMYTVKTKDCFRYVDRVPQQHLNHFEGAKALTTKIGLTHSMKNLVWRKNMDIDAFFPQSYDLSDLQSEEFKDFSQDFKYCQAIAALKQCSAMKQQNIQKNMDKFLIALSICEARLKAHSDEIFQLKEISNEFDCITDDQYYLLADGKVFEPYQNSPWFKKIQKQYKDVNQDNLKDLVKACLDKIKDLLGNQFYLIHTKNAWILKPGGKSRGRGITIHNKIDNIVNTIQQSADEDKWVIQKYIENPMIILQKKFDIRQWIVVTSWEPLTIWMYDECYLRFTSENYDPSKIHDKFMHLTNNSIAKHSSQFQNSVIEGNMWKQQQFIEFLNQEYGKDGQDVFKTKILPQIKAGLIASVVGAADGVVNRPNSHEMFGYDFMVDTFLNVWVIEVNASPSMEYSTHVTTRLVKEVLQQIPLLVIDTQYGTTVEQEEGTKVGNFELIYKEQ